jgi:hypothetical protein
MSVRYVITAAVFAAAILASTAVTGQVRANEDIGVPPAVTEKSPGIFEARAGGPGVYSVMLRMPKAAGGPRVYVDTVSVSRTFLSLPADTLRAIGNTSHTVQTVLGNAWGEIDISVTYRLPMPETKKDVPYRLVLETGWATHLFSLAQGDTVYAARKGTIIMVDTPRRKMASQAVRGQRVVVQHIDGSWACYTGIAQGSVVVRPGQTVWPDSPLGTAGLNGKYGYSVLLAVKAPMAAQDRRGRGFFELSDIHMAFGTLEMRDAEGRGKGWIVTPRVSYEIITQEMTRDDIEQMIRAAGGPPEALPAPPETAPGTVPTTAPAE